MNVVVDTNVVVSGIFWPGESRDCLAVSVPIFEEYCEVAHRLGRRIREVNPEPWLQWIERKAKIYEPAPLSRQRVRDPDDDPFLSCALASSATIVVSKDQDLLTLGKPFGIEILVPRQLLARFK